MGPTWVMTESAQLLCSAEANAIHRQHMQGHLQDLSWAARDEPDDIMLVIIIIIIIIVITIIIITIIVMIITITIMVTIMLNIIMIIYKYVYIYI